ncbi:hypothetical protein MLD38_027214 [Melastoma candidum]|uniref:Uncharacterized protein n=1 Tax=Melastoma candidum TaxID=119954 RepID=A0ACB9P227_9MYRT|nr:hypothetical protein MLD38_027214 [Melastoma candidum]
MAEEERRDVPAEESHPPPPFLVVTCTATGKERRFAAGTAASFAVSLINKKLGSGSPSALYIEAAKAGEEPIAFGPNALLVDYGNGWKLRTVTDIDQYGDDTSGRFPQRSTHAHDSGSGGSHGTRAKSSAKPVINFVYIGKIVIAFIFIFVMGAFFTLALEYLPLLIQAINTFM